MHVITGVGNEAVIAAMACAAYPEEAKYSIPALDKEFPVYRLPLGTENPDGDMKFEITEKGDGVYIKFIADDDSKPKTNGPHNYDIEKLPLEVLPAVDPGKHVYLQGNGQFPLKASIAYSYCDRCKSINWLAQGSSKYVCVASFCKERKVGDETEA